jgi:poly(3-hydroxybutyrate) depolymerase
MSRCHGFLQAGSGILAALAMALALGVPVTCEDAAEVHFFIFSGQSNLLALKPEEAFLPEVRRQLPGTRIKHVQVAYGGTSIAWWSDQLKNWTPPGANAEKLAIYKELLVAIREELGLTKPTSVTLLWMQGERDGQDAWRKNHDGQWYEQQLYGLIGNLRRDLGVPEMKVVIARISDFSAYPQWQGIREAQMRVAQGDPHARRFDTDDLNGPKNELHYVAGGTKILGERFAKYAVELIKGKLEASNPPSSSELTPKHPAQDAKLNQPVELPLGEAHVYKKGGESLPYRLVAPVKVEPGVRYPLIVCLHRAGSRGQDNQKHQIGFTGLLQPAVRERFPAYLVFPQCPANQIWATFGWGTQSPQMQPEPNLPLRLTKELLDELLTRLPLDGKRVYLTGMSMGGYGAWEAIQRWPEFFAAAAPVCGGGDPAQAARLVAMPRWVFHGKKDGVIKVETSARMVEALKNAGANPTFTVYPNVTHEAWIPAYQEPEFMPWLCSQKRP